MKRALLPLLLSLAPGHLGQEYVEKVPYIVTAEHEGWQERTYSPTRWISTNRSDITAHDGDKNDEAFQDLLNYFNGKNSGNQEIPMTTPVTLRIIPGEGPNCESFFTMSFFIP